MEVTIKIDEQKAHAVAGVLDMLASERRTAAGSVSRSGKGEFTYVESFRETLHSVADQIREGADAARDAERYGAAVRDMEVCGDGGS